jgi:hypothetical protein
MTLFRSIYASVALAAIFFMLLLPLMETSGKFNNNICNAALFMKYSHYPVDGTDTFDRDWLDWRRRVIGPAITGKLTDWVMAKSLAQMRQNLNGAELPQTFMREVATNMVSCGNIFPSVIQTNGQAVPIQLETPSVGMGFWRFNYLVCVFAGYHALWLLATFLLISFYRPDSLFIIFATFSALILNATVAAGQWYFPFDLPCMFFVTWAWLAYDARQPLWLLLPIILVGALFKPTAMLVGGAGTVG